MKITLKYDRGVKKEEIVTLEVCETELEQMIENDYQLRLAAAKEGEVVKYRSAEELFDELNKQEFNSWRKHQRYLDSRVTTSVQKDEDYIEMDMIGTVADHSWIEERQRREGYEALCQKIHQLLKPAQADMVITICLDGINVKDYAFKIGNKPNYVTQRLNHAKKILAKNIN